MNQQFPTNHNQQTKNRRLLAIHAHPDDETITTGGLLARCNKAGIDTYLLTCTDGRHGPINPQLGLSLTPSQLAKVRRTELRVATRILQLHKVRELNYYDSGMLGFPSNIHPRAFCSQDPENLIREFVAIIRKWRPQIVITYDPFGFTGHPDHIQVHRTSILAIEAAAEARAFPDKGTPWEVGQVYYPAYPITNIEQLISDQLSESKPHPFNGLLAAQINFTTPDSYATHRVDIRSVYEEKKMALNAHQTQVGPHNPALYLAALARREYEHFKLAFSRISDNNFADILEII